jgi:hypothetical protein
MKRLTSRALSVTLAAAALAAAAPTAGASPGVDNAQPNCIGFFRANPDPGTPVAGGNRQDPGATQGGLGYIGDFARDAQPCWLL